jgi:hypothetical protein
MFLLGSMSDTENAEVGGRSAAGVAAGVVAGVAAGVAAVASVFCCCGQPASTAVTARVSSNTCGLRTITLELRPVGQQ